MTKSVKTINRLRRIEGQVRGIIKMLEEDRYCIDILTQMQAIKSAVARAESEILKDHANSCVATAIESGDADAQRDGRRGHGDEGLEQRHRQPARGLRAQPLHVHGELRIAELPALIDVHLVEQRHELSLHGGHRALLDLGVELVEEEHDGEVKLRAVERSVGVVVHLGERGIDVLAEARAARDAAGEGVEEPHGRRDAF